jgi:4-amino-4-deoxy-L-arabinose transferase-like glycosyltransferase
MTDALSLAPQRPPQNLKLMQALVAFFLLLKLIFLFGAGPTSDEAYYWLWGQHPALSYFDHPPLHAWLLGLVRLVLGHNIFALRFLTLATLAGSLYIFALWARRYAGAGWRPYFWAGAVIYLASGIFGQFFSIAFQDYLFAFLGLVAAHFFLSYLGDVSGTGRGRLRDLYLGAVFLGFCALTKYTALFFGVALVATIVLSRDLRVTLRSVHLYLAALLAIAMQAPVVIWNARHGWVSFGFQLAGRHGGGWEWLMHPSLSRIVEFPLASVLLVGPFLVPVFVRFFLTRPATAFESVAKRYALGVFWITSLTILGASLFDYVNFWWNIPAYVVVMGFAARYMGRILFYGHAVYGAGLALLVVFNFVVIPIPTLLGRYDFRFAQPYGLAELQATLPAAEARYQPDFIASDLPEVANLVAFALNDPNVTSLTPLRNAFDDWFDPVAHVGKTALIVLDSVQSPDAVAARFDGLTPVEDIEVARFGHTIRTFRLYFAEGFHG